MDNGLVLACVSPGLMGRVWPRVSDMIEAGYAAGDNIMPDDMLRRLQDDKVQLWVAIDQNDGVIHAAMTTELVPMKSGLACFMCQAAGDRLSDWKHFHKRIEEYAKAEGCVKVILRGRIGWQRKLEGYSVRAVQMEKLL